jgi:RNA-directed DNA polymerase
MNELGKSDRPAVPEKSSNKTGQPEAEEMEGRGLTKGNPPQQNASRTRSRRAQCAGSGYVRQQRTIRR